MVGADEVGVNGLAGVPTVASWWNASSSGFVMIASCVEFNWPSCGGVQSAISTLQLPKTGWRTHIGAQQDWTLEEGPRCEVRPLLLYGEVAVADLHHVPVWARSARRWDGFGMHESTYMSLCE